MRYKDYGWISAMWNQCSLASILHRLQLRKMASSERGSLKSTDLSSQKVLFP